MTNSQRMPDDRTLIQQQFGAHAEDYVHSRDHVAGESLDRMLALLDLPAEGRVLDIATGGGHTALALAPHVGSVVASDLTHPMLLAARRSLADKGHAGVKYVQADAHILPWAAGAFDLVTCRIAPHHFADVAGFVKECTRVARTGGRVAVIDNITPADLAAARYINAYEKLRDPSHGWEYSTADWESFFRAADLQIEHLEEFRKPIRFYDWVERMSVPDHTRLQLRALLHHTPQAARAALNPREEDGHLTFDLGEVLIIGRLGSSY